MERAYKLKVCRGHRKFQCLISVDKRKEAKEGEHEK